MILQILDQFQLLLQFIRYTYIEGMHNNQIYGHHTFNHKRTDVFDTCKPNISNLNTHITLNKISKLNAHLTLTQKLAANLHQNRSINNVSIPQNYKTQNFTHSNQFVNPKNFNNPNQNQKGSFTLAELFQNFHTQHNQHDIILQIRQEANIVMLPKNNSYQYQRQKHAHKNAYKHINKNTNQKTERAVPIKNVVPSHSKVVHKIPIYNQKLTGKNFETNLINSRNISNFNSQKENILQNLPQRFTYQNEQDQQQFIFRGKKHQMSNRKNSLLNALKAYQRSTSKSHSNSRNKLSHSPKNSKIKSQIRMSPINSKLILQKLNTNRKTNFTSDQEEPSFSNSNQSLMACDNKVNLLIEQQLEPHDYQFVQNIIHNHSHIHDHDRKEIMNNRKEIMKNNGGANNFSFDQDKHFINNFTNNNPHYNQEGLSNSINVNRQLHTIEEVQQSIRSIQLPHNQHFDHEITRKITEHFEEIKQNMLKELIIRSRSGNTIDQASMESIVQELQIAANSIVRKYQSSFQQNNVKRLQENERICSNLKANSNSNHSSCIVNRNSNHPACIINPDICGSDQNQIQKVFLHKSSKNDNKKVDLDQLFNSFDKLGNFNQSKDNKNIDNCGKSKLFNQFMKKGLILTQNQEQKLNLDGNRNNMDSNYHGVGLKIVNQSFAEDNKNASQIKLLNDDRLATPNQSLQYGVCSKGQSSISSIKSIVDLKNQTQIETANQQTNSNKDSMKAEVQSLNRYTFLKHYKDKPFTIDANLNNVNVAADKFTTITQPSNSIYTYQQKELDQNQYKITQQNKKDNSQVYTVRYNLKMLNIQHKNQQKNGNFTKIEQVHQRKSQVEVFRLSPLKFRKKEQVVEQMVKAKMISKQSQSFFR